MMKSGYLQRYIDLFSQRKEKFAVVNNMLFRVYRNMIVSSGPLSQDYSLSEEDIASLMERLPGILVRWTTGITDDPLSEWYAIICDTFQPVEKLRKKQRRDVNRGLNSCTVRRITADQLSKEGHEVHVKALTRYGQTISSETTDSFRAKVKANSGFNDIIHYWGVFHQDKLIAFSLNYLFDRIEVSYSMINFHPDYMKFCPSAALFYRMNEYYLRDEGFGYVNDGFRSILHESSIQDYLEKKFNFRKAYTGLGVAYRFPYSVLVRTGYPLRNVFGKLDRRLNALFELERVRRGSQPEFHTEIFRAPKA